MKKTNKVKMLQKIANAIQTTNWIIDENSLQTRIFLLNSLVLSHFLLSMHAFEWLYWRKSSQIGKAKNMGYTDCHENKHERFCHTWGGKQRISPAIDISKYRSTQYPQKLSQNRIRAYLAACSFQFSCQDCVKSNDFAGLPIYINKKF